MFLQLLQSVLDLRLRQHNHALLLALLKQAQSRAFRG